MASRKEPKPLSLVLVTANVPPVVAAVAVAEVCCCAAAV